MKELTNKLKEKSVGADASVRPCFRGMHRENKGITLIALIITIIVMLILVAVTVSFTIGENGILNQAKTSKKEYEKAGEKDILTIEAIACYDHETGEVDGEKLKNSTALSDWELTGTNIIVCQSPKQNTYKVEKDGTVSEVTPVEKYLLGDKLQGRNILAIATPTEQGFEMEDDPDTEFDETEYNIEFVSMYSGLFEDNEVCVYLKYDDKIYNIFANPISQDNVETNGEKGFNFIYDAKEETKIGKYVKYKEKDYIIIYDNEKTGIQMVSLEPRTLSDGSYITLEYGIDWESEKVKKEANILNDGEEISSLEKGIYAYNHSTETLNKACADIIEEDATIIKDVRSVGTNPIDKTKENKNWYKSDYLATQPTSPQSEYKPGVLNGKIYGIDNNWENDYHRMQVLGINDIQLQSNYWIASKDIHLTEDNVYGEITYIGVRYMIKEDKRISDIREPIEIKSGMIRSEFGGRYYAVRPVITLQEGVLDSATGEGTQSNPYVIQ